MADRFLPSSWNADGISVRDVAPDEVDLVASLHQSRQDVASVDKSFRPAQRAEYAELVEASCRNESDGKPFRLQIIRTAAEQPCGYFHAFGGIPDPDSFFISMFFVAPDHARQGVGARVVSRLMDRVALAGYERALLTVSLANREALSFWIAQGFDRIHRFRRTEEGGGPDRFILERDLRQ